MYFRKWWKIQFNMSIDQTPVVRRMDKTIHWINLYQVDNAIHSTITYYLEIYLLDSIIHLLNNWTQQHIWSPLQPKFGLITQHTCNVQHSVRTCRVTRPKISCEGDHSISGRDIKWGQKIPSPFSETANLNKEM